jgi:hypothetical protein
VECTDDHALSIEMQRDMIAKSPPVDVRTLHSSHSPFLSMPDLPRRARPSAHPGMTAGGLRQRSQCQRLPEEPEGLLVWHTALSWSRDEKFLASIM